MSFFDDMKAGKEFASNGAMFGMSETQKRTGLAFLGDSPPSVELHNELWRESDRKVNWLFQQLAELHNYLQLRRGDNSVLIPNRPFTEGDSLVLADAFNLRARAYNNNIGYHTLPGKLILTWGVAVVPASGTTNSGVSLNLAVSMPNGIVYAGGSPQDQVNSQLGFIPSVLVRSESAGRIFIGIDAGGTNINRNVPVNYLTLGY